MRNRLVLSEVELLVQRVFAHSRSRTESSQMFEQRMHSSATLTEMWHRTVQRVLEKSERVEERRMQSLVLRREARSAEGDASASRPREISATSPWGASVGKSGFAMTNGHMPIGVNRLTDQVGHQIDVNRLTDQVVHQIDSRMTAYRERMGKVF